MIFSIAYLPPISYVSALLKAKSPVLEKHEHYVKQTYRNRAILYGPNGPLQLIIPIQHQKGMRIPIDNVKMNHESAWLNIHWKTITSCYRNSAYFEFFEAELEPLYEKEAEKLFDFNLLLLQKIFEILNVHFVPTFTESFTKELPNDFRNSFDPHERKEMQRYRQVFEDRYGFLSDLSILDLICNEGKRAKDYLLL